MSTHSSRKRSSSGARVYRDYDQATLDAQYDQRTLVPDLSPYLERWQQDSAAAHAALSPQVGLAYGPSTAERLDLFPAQQPRGLVVYLHGGAWRMLGKTESAYPAASLLAHGLSFAAVDFALVPAVSLREQVRQCRAALAWLYVHAQVHGASNICVLGHSSGAHLAAVLATTDWSSHAGLPHDPVRSGVLVSGVFDLEPVRLSARNDYLQLDSSGVADLSPARQIRAPACRLLVAWGDGELDEFQRQSSDFAMRWCDAGNRCATMTVTGLNHFDMSLEFARADSTLHRALIEVALGN